MNSEVWIPTLGLTATILLVVVGLLNFSVFLRQLQRRPELLYIFRTADARNPIDYAVLTMQRRR